MGITTRGPTLATKGLSSALQLQNMQDRWFWDASDSGYFTTRNGDHSILFWTREPYDGAEPSPSSVAAMNLLRIWQITDGLSWKQKADKTLATFSAIPEKQPEAVPFMASAFDYSLGQAQAGGNRRRARDGGHGQTAAAGLAAL
jgi:uncharacterized protein YyaL (SSP411 family)